MRALEILLVIFIFYITMLNKYSYNNSIRIIYTDMLFSIKYVFTQLYNVDVVSSVITYFQSYL